MLHLTDRTSQIGSATTGALGASARLEVLPTLTLLVHAYRSRDAHRTAGAIRSISSLLTLVVLNETLTPFKEEAITRAVDMLEVLANPEVEVAYPIVRDTAIRELSWILHRFGSLWGNGDQQV